MACPTWGTITSEGLTDTYKPVEGRCPVRAPQFEKTHRLLSLDDRKPFKWLDGAKGTQQFNIDGANDSSLRVMAFQELQHAEVPERVPMLLRNGEPLFRARQVIQVFADRGTGKSLFVRTLALIMAGKGDALGFSSPGAFRVLYIDGEMSADEIKSRDALLAKASSLSTLRPTLLTIAADWQDDPMPRLDTEEGQQAIDPFVEWADVVIVDNRSCLFSAAGERDPIVWHDAQRWILDLRRRGKMVILVHHANRQGGARGISNAEDFMDFNIELARPEDYDAAHGARFEVLFRKHRPGAVEPMTVHLTTNGWKVEASGDTLNSLERKILDTLSEGEFRTRRAIQEAIGGNAKKFWKTFESLEDRGVVHEVRRKVGKGVASKSVTVWEADIEIARKFGYLEGSK
jgi:hypothetical protein